ncbi:MAG: hypothetical protein AAGA56_15915 [Myxococcota bacterium]
MSRWSAIIIALLMLSGCRTPPVSIAEGPREYVATDYDDVRKLWTREETLYLFDELERALTVSATFESWDFRWAYVIRYAQDYRLTIPQRQRLLRERLEETRSTHEFFIALYGAERRYNDLTRSDSAWIVRLIDDLGNETAPMQIERIARPNILERRYYPYNTVWRQAFRLRFPAKGKGGQATIPTEAKLIGLRFAGAWGNFDLTWEIGSSPEGDAAPVAVSRRASSSP